MSMSMSMSMSMMSAGGGGAPVGFGATPDDLGYRPLTLSFPLGPNAIPGFPLQPLPNSKWKWEDASWDPDLLAILCALEVPPAQWQAIVIDPTLADANYGGELGNLQDLMRQDRERYLTEILAQHDHAPLYWMSLLGITHRTKPNTVQVIHNAVKLGEMAVVHFKDVHKRPRPSQICPGLLPPFGPPGHPAFPSGHSTQGWLISNCLKKIVPEYWEQLKWLTKRVALNRERAGFHYRSDTRGGRDLAKKLIPIIDGMPANSHFQKILFAAKSEWN
jgi:hypothetical protein